MTFLGDQKMRGTGQFRHLNLKSCAKWKRFLLGSGLSRLGLIKATHLVAPD